MHVNLLTIFRYAVHDSLRGPSQAILAYVISRQLCFVLDLWFENCIHDLKTVFVS